MKSLTTYELWLQPEPDIHPSFHTLHWKSIDVPLRDVLLDGIHPWNPKVSYNLHDKFLRILNQDEFSIPALRQFGFSGDISLYHDPYGSKGPALIRLLQQIQSSIYFVRDLSYLELLEIAKEELRKTWSHYVAREMLKSTYMGFQDLRQFLKKKNKRIKLSSYNDIDNYNLGKELSLEDFKGKDGQIIDHAIPVTNFRRMDFLKTVTDEKGRLKLVPEIKELSLHVCSEKDPSEVRVMLNGRRKGQIFTFHPNVGDSVQTRIAAAHIATKWRIDDGKLVFQTSLEKIEEMVEKGVAVPMCPGLNYTLGNGMAPSTATVRDSRVETFHIGPFITNGVNADVLEDVLRRYGVPTTGNKTVLVGKVAKLAAEQYAKHERNLDKYFRKNRFMRIHAASAKASDFRVLEGIEYLRNLLLTMFAMKHLRGNVLLETEHENEAYTVEELALALLNRAVGLHGSFLRIA